MHTIYVNKTNDRLSIPINVLFYKRNDYMLPKNIC
jgi:hypothetical protein